MLYWAVLVPSLALIGFYWLHRKFRVAHHGDASTPTDCGLEFKSFEVPTVAGRLLSTWWIPAERARASAVLIHGWGSGKAQLLPLAQPFRDLGINLLMIDARNHGDSDRHSFSSMPRFAEDVRASIDWLLERFPETAELPLIVAGHSVGAGAVLLEASRSDAIDAVICLSPFAHPEDVMNRYLKTLYFPQCLIRGVNLYVEWVIGFRFDEIAPEHTITQLTQPVLVAHGNRDATVPMSEARRIFEAADGNAQWLEVDGAGHDLSCGVGPEEVAGLKAFLCGVLSESG